MHRRCVCMGCGLCAVWSAARSGYLECSRDCTGACWAHRTPGAGAGRGCRAEPAAVSTGGRAGSIAALVTTSEPSAETILPSAFSLPSLIASLTWRGWGWECVGEGAG